MTTSAGEVLPRNTTGWKLRNKPMRKYITAIRLALLVSVALSPTLLAHPGGHGIRSENELRAWTNIVTGEMVRASFLFARDGQVCVERANGDAVVFPLNDLAEADRKYAEAQLERIRQRNHQMASRPTADTVPAESRSPLVFIILLAVILSGIGAALLRRRLILHRSRVAVSLSLLVVVFSGFAARHYAQTNRPAAAAPFDAYAPKVRTRWDDKYLYVESTGIPDHALMSGIRTWQQQVPIPQPYFGENAWSIPLNPVLAAQPVSARTALFTGAIALAANGVPIFNALNNRGVDSFSIGELDEFGGHCGRADDYHYHAAPLHIQAKVGPADWLCARWFSVIRAGRTGRGIRHRTG